AVFQFPGGLADHLAEQIGTRECVTQQAFSGRQDFPKGEDGSEQGRVEWAIAWPLYSDGAYSWYCNTVPTPDGGTHEQGLRSALTRALKDYGEMIGNRRAAQVTGDDIMAGAVVLLSVFIENPQFQGQTKDRLTSADAAKLVEGAVKDHFDHFLSADPATARVLLDHLIDKAEERIKR